MSNKKTPIVISVGGSLVIPGEIDIDFLKKFRNIILNEIKKGQKFILVVGGGKIARVYQQAAKKVIPVNNQDLDWIGIHSTRLNAQLLRIIFQKQAYPKIITNKQKINPKIQSKIIIASGFRPGNSTDYIAVLLAKAYKAKTIINLSNIDWVYTKDPRKFKNAKLIKKITWPTFLKITGTKWEPGENVPFDPIASKYAYKWGMKVIICNGKDYTNLGKLFKGQEHKGTVIA